MKFAKIVFWVAGGWGVLILTPLYFIFNLIGRQDPPAITHPGFYYGFAGAALTWQFVFFVIAQDPARLRPAIIPSVFEKAAYGGAVIALYAQDRISAGDPVFGCVDLLFGALFVMAYVKTAPRPAAV